MKNITLKSAVTLFLVIGIFTLIASADDFGPWSVSTQSPTFSSVPSKTSESKSSYAADACFLWLHVYQHHLNAVMISKCPMHPSCSTYSIHAITKHGSATGLMLTFDRLIHESDEKNSGYKIMVGHRLKVLDPVENNDFWWYK